jgi:NADH-quinone oxidoreductase subunit H
MNEFWRYAAAVLVWPGILVAAPLGWFALWFVRKLTARLQGRQGPPFMQPFWDVMKLLGKRTVIPTGVSSSAFHALPLIALASVAAALAIVPMPGNPVPSLPGDLVLLLYLLEVPVLCEVLAGYVTRSVYGQVSAMREAILSLGYNLPFLASVIALAQSAGSFNLQALQTASYGPIHLLAAIGFLMALPARLKTNPFSIPNAEHEIVADAHIEYNGAPLALFKLSHALEVVLLCELFAVLFVPRLPWGLPAAALYLGVGLGVLALVTLLANSTARVRLNTAFRFYWLWGGLVSGAAVVAAVIW